MCGHGVYGHGCTVSEPYDLDRAKNAPMLAMLQDLVQHKNYANCALLQAIAKHEPAAADLQLRTLLHHIILANRFWFSSFVDKPFEMENEAKVPESLRAVAMLYRDTHEQEIQWIYELRNDDLNRVIMTPFIPDQSFSLSQALMQVCLHSQGHRAQAAIKLRAMGGNPPAMDFVLWLKERPVANWSQAD